MPVLRKCTPIYFYIVSIFRLLYAISPQKRIASVKGYKNRFQRASLTAEAALVFPIFFFSIYLFWQCFLLLLFQINVCNQVSEAAMNYAHLGYLQRKTEGESVDISWLYLPLLWNAVPENEKVEQILVFCNSQEDGTLEVDISYYFCCESLFFAKIKIPVQQKLQFYPYLGEYDTDLLVEEDTNFTETSKDVVYMTEHGTVYHESKACGYLTVTVRKVAADKIGEQRNSSGEVYQQCSRCRKEEKGEWVYISDGGNRYHWNLNCTTIKRTILEMKREEVVGIPACHKCKNKE